MVVQASTIDTWKTRYNNAMHTERRSPCVLNWKVTCRRPVIVDVILLGLMMPLSKCPHCEESLPSDLDAFCPYCHEPLPTFADPDRSFSTIQFAEKLKINLSSLLLLVALAAVSTAWYTSRNENARLISRHAVEVEQVAKGGLEWGASLEARGIAKHLNENNGSTEEFIKRELVMRLFITFQFKNEINLCIEKLNFSHTASETVKKTLDELECASFDQYYPLFLEIYEGKYRDEYKDGGSEHETFRDFIESSLVLP